MRAAFGIRDKLERQDAVAAAKETILAALTEEERADANLDLVIKKLESDVVRWDILNDGRRIDGRDLVTVRPIVSEVGVLPRTHGSALFTRGETQALVVTTLGTGDDEQMIDALHGTSRSNFLLHYNFPPYSVGEAGRMGSPGRREIGHGKLAWRALQAVLPAATDFPYTIRIVSEITESNGSSSMATVCGSSLVDDGRRRAAEGAGRRRRHGPDPRGREVRRAHRHPRRRGPPRRHGLQGRRHRERHHLAADGHQGRRHHARRSWSRRSPRRRPAACTSSARWRKALTAGRAEFSAHAPRIETMTDRGRQDPRGDRLGRQGDPLASSRSRAPRSTSTTTAPSRSPRANSAAIEKARELIAAIVDEPEVGRVYTGKVVKIMDFGAFVNFFGKRDGLVHVSQLSNERVGHPKDILQEGQSVKVKLMGFDERGKVRLSMKAIDQETGAGDQGRRLTGVPRSPQLPRSRPMKRSPRNAQSRGEFF